MINNDLVVGGSYELYPYGVRIILPRQIKNSHVRRKIFVSNQTMKNELGTFTTKPLDNKHIRSAIVFSQISSGSSSSRDRYENIQYFNRSPRVASLELFYRHALYTNHQGQEFKGRYEFIDQNYLELNLKNHAPMKFKLTGKVGGQRSRQLTRIFDESIREKALTLKHAGPRLTKYCGEVEYLSELPDGNGYWIFSDEGNFHIVTKRKVIGMNLLSSKNPGELCVFSTKKPLGYNLVVVKIARDE